MWPVICAMFVCCILSFIFKSYFLSLIFLILFLVVLAARIWSSKAAEKITFNVTNSETGLFPGESMLFKAEIKNNKFLPVMNSELYFPLSENLCLIPENVRKAEDYEKAYLEEHTASLEKVGEKKLPAVLWYETQNASIKWTAEKRGVYKTSGWKFRAGDGFGLSQVELPFTGEDSREIAVYPGLVQVNTSMFMRMAWSADTGARGVMEDNTVIRSTRDYQAGDPVKNINWRLRARGLPLSVNVYEEILPQSVYFIFDGESFSGAEKHLDEMEEALSIISSSIISLEGKVRAGICFSKDAKGQIVNLETGSQTEDILWAFAAYEPMEDKKGEGEKVINQRSEFDQDAIEAEESRAGRFYYVTYDAENISENDVFRILDQDKTTILSYRDSKKYADFETRCLTELLSEENPGVSGDADQKELETGYEGDDKKNDQ